MLFKYKIHREKPFRISKKESNVCTKVTFKNFYRTVSKKCKARKKNMEQNIKFGSLQWAEIKTLIELMRHQALL